MQLLTSASIWFGTKCGAGPETCTKRGCAGASSQTFCTTQDCGLLSCGTGLAGIPALSSINLHQLHMSCTDRQLRIG